MLTLHVPSEGDAVLVADARVAALGPAAELAAAHPAARERRWAGVIGPGRCRADAAAWLESAYHPDPREELGSGPLDPAAVGPLDDARWGGSARRGLQRLLADGVTALVGPFTRLPVRTAVQRSGLPVLAGPREPVLAVGGPAHFAVRAPDGTCLATVVSGRIVYRRR
ncbi:hypothetical protein [Streptomyces sp. JJ38]|uniref:imidazolonepropionase-like domain-containing protein n=1 Tax=Streptomyces sp. JJ38 TaxID=2738128 RepID=UPI001C575BC1|nr:hypothetical protein [Streptomyces sp. JJ38]MBW1597431.1 hypothetical protein [Streptomyces sp. JJ38]